MKEAEALFEPYKRQAQKKCMQEAVEEASMLAAEDMSVAKVLLSEEYVAESEFARHGWASLLLKLQPEPGEDQHRGWAVVPASNMHRHCQPLLEKAMRLLHITRLLYGPTITDSAAAVGNTC